MDTRIIEYILTIQEEKTLTKAAEKLFITQSALSQQLKKLELEIGTPLFYRENNEFHLTDAGKIYTHGAQSVLYIKKEALARLRELHITEYNHFLLHIPASLNQYAAEKLLPRFNEAFPAIQLDISNQKPDFTAAGNPGETALLALLPDYLSTADDMELIPLATADIQLALPHHHPFLQTDYRNGIADLSLFSEDQLILHSHGSYLNDIADRLLAKCYLPPTLLCEVRSLKALFHLLAAEQGIALLPSAIAKNDKGFCTMPLVPPCQHHIMIAFAKNIPLTPPLRQLILLLLESFDKDSSLAGLFFT